MTKKCIYCGTPHTNKSEESNYQETGDACQRCSFIVKTLELFVESTNRYIPFGAEKPMRFLTITGFEIKKI